MEELFSGQLFKMKVTNEKPILYQLKSKDFFVDVNDWIGKNIRITFLNEINCIKCHKKTKTSFGQGFCYNCFISAPESAECIIKPELCKAHLGEGRDVDWEEKNHNQPHYVYLAVSSAIKVGVTRVNQVPTRFIDQGASEAIVVAETPNRYLAGVIEVALKDLFTDKTNWRKMLKNEVLDNVDLEEQKWELEEVLPVDLSQYMCDDDTVFNLNYPVNIYPEKVSSFNLDKNPIAEGKLLGIKGQYLIFDNNKVINIRKYTGYNVTIEEF